MKTIIATSLMILLTAQALTAWPGYYGGGYQNYPYNNYYQYGGYGYGNNYDYDYNYGRDYTKPMPPAQMPAPKITPPSTVTPPPVAPPPPTKAVGSALEQQHDKLIIMFTKDACPYCQYMKPIMQDAGMKYGSAVKIIFVDVTEQPNTPQQYGFSTVPQIMYFKDGKRLETHGSGDKTITLTDVEGKIKTHFDIK